MSAKQSSGTRPGAKRPAGKGSGGFKPGPKRRGGGLPVFPIVIGAVVVLGVVAVVLAASGEDSPAGPLEVAPVTIEGEPLEGFVTTSPDPAVGAAGPTLRGEDFDGAPVVIEPDGRKKALVFLVHTCPNCDAEAPEIADVIDAGEVPDDVDLYVVASNVTRNGANYPPSEWLEGHGLGDAPTLLDSEDSEAAAAYGMTAFPYWVLLDEDHEVTGRITGQLGRESIVEVLGLLSAGEPIGTGVEAGPATDG